MLSDSLPICDDKFHLRQALLHSSFLFYFLAKARRILVSQPGTEPTPTAVVQDPHYCAARAVPLDSSSAALHRLR